MPSQIDIEGFRSDLRGELINRENPAYEEARKLYNGMIDKKPLLIARCANVADVITSVNFGRDNKILVAIRGGGHNGPGLGSCDDGLVLDLSQMNGIRINPKNRTVRVEAGCTQGDVDHATHSFGLAVPAGIVSTTGIAGLTLGGGHGYLTRRYGLTIDNLIEADIVLADGSFVTASETENSDLFWALRGGGGNFGVVTSFLFQAHPVKEVFGGPVFWDAKHAREVMQWYREFLPGSPEELYSFLGLKTVPSTAPFPEQIWGKKVCALISCFSGPLDEAEEALRPIREELPAPLMDGMGPLPFPTLQSLFDPLLPKGMQLYWKGDFVKDLPDASIDAHLEHHLKAPSELSLMHLYPIDGAVHRVSETETAWGCRDATWSMVIVAIDPDPSSAEGLKTWGRSYWEAVHPHNLGGAYVNFMSDDEGEARVKASYGNNHARLVKVKNQYDPANLFRVNHNIEPTA